MSVAVIHVHVLYQPELLQEVHGAVDAGQAHLGVDGQGAAVDLGHLQVVGGIRQDPEDGQPGASELQALRLQDMIETSVAHGTHLN